MILICYLGTTECGIPAAPGYNSEQECREALTLALNNLQIPQHMIVVAAKCYGWGNGA